MKIPTETASRPVLLKVCLESMLTVEMQFYLPVHFRTTGGPVQYDV